MCIRDRVIVKSRDGFTNLNKLLFLSHTKGFRSGESRITCLLYTSDAADERSSVDLGGRRIIKKKQTETKRMRSVRKRTESMNNEAGI